MEQILPLLYQHGYRANCYLVWSGSEAALVDPTVPYERVESVLAEHGLRLKYLLLTHAHYDHLITLYDPEAFPGLPVHIHAADAPALSDPRAMACPSAKRRFISSRASSSYFPAVYRSLTV